MYSQDDGVETPPHIAWIPTDAGWHRDGYLVASADEGYFTVTDAQTGDRFCTWPLPDTFEELVWSLGTVGIDADGLERWYAAPTAPEPVRIDPAGPAAEALSAARIDLVGLIEGGIPERQYVPGSRLLLVGKRYLWAASAGACKSLTALVEAVAVVKAGGRS
jgi:hypothetical protein